jgi:hypothetical protein
MWLCLPTGLFESGFLNKVLSEVFVCSISAMYHTQLICIDFVAVAVTFDDFHLIYPRVYIY